MKKSENPKLYPLSGYQNLLRWAEVFTFEPKEMRRFNVLNFYVRVRENGNPAMLEKALNSVIDRNDSLRIKILRKGLKLQQCVRSENIVKCEYARVADDAALQRYIRRRQLEIIPWTEESLIRGTLIQVGSARDWVLLVRIHHAVCDGYSIALFCKQISEAYALYMRHEVPKWINHPSFFDALKREMNYHTSDAHSDDMEFWKKTYQSQPRYSFPAGRRARHSQCGRVLCALEGDDYRALVQASQEAQCSRMSYLLSLVALTTYALTGKHNFCLYTMTHGRLNYAQRRTMGCLMNTVPVMYLIRKKRPAAKQFGTWYKNYLEALSHGRLPMGEQTPLSYKECFRNGLNFNHGWMLFSAMDPLVCAPDSGMEAHMIPFTHLGQQLYLAVRDVDNSRLEFELFYQSERFTQDGMERARDALFAIRRMVAENADITPLQMRKLLPKFID